MCDLPVDRRTNRPVSKIGTKWWHTSCLQALATAEAITAAAQALGQKPAPDLMALFIEG